MPVAQPEPEAEESGTGVITPAVLEPVSWPLESLAISESLELPPSENVVYWPTPLSTALPAEVWSAPGWPILSRPWNVPLTPCR